MQHVILDRIAVAILRGLVSGVFVGIAALVVVLVRSNRLTVKKFLSSNEKKIMNTLTECIKEAEKASRLSSDGSCLLLMKLKFSEKMINKRDEIKELSDDRDIMTTTIEWLTDIAYSCISFEYTRYFTSWGDLNAEGEMLAFVYGYWMKRLPELTNIATDDATSNIEKLMNNISTIRRK